MLAPAGKLNCTRVNEVESETAPVVDAVYVKGAVPVALVPQASARNVPVELAIASSEIVRPLKPAVLVEKLK